MENQARVPDLKAVIDAAEAASPVEAVESVTRELAAALDATGVSFLIADLSGRALVRLAHVRPGRGSGAAPPLAACERRSLRVVLERVAGHLEDPVGERADGLAGVEVARLGDRRREVDPHRVPRPPTART